ncbi:hypothetical protein BRARA_F02210 [Brassica rapa]|uniref:Histone deacetylase domain-containing protein n=1 Tax=Brassica campestris TaxID=3711 RepID=A0A397Z038_BRACM|nr:hypothetical protein BRARA_F02210 [Brassica rapa]
METDESGVSLASGPDGRKRRVSYFYEPTIGNYYYGQGHPMKPHRIRMAHSLIVHYNLHRRLEISRPYLADAADIGRFHSPEYVDFLRSVSPESVGDSSARNLRRFNVGEDCPVFDGLFEFCRASAGGSIGAAVKLNRQDADIAINWGGGLHHAKKSEASGFCYVNDIVLGILELLKMFRYFEYFGPDYTLHVEPGPMENLNTPKDMERIRNTLLEQLSGLIHAPSVPFQHTPPVNRVLDEPEEDLEKRPKPRIWSGTANYESDSDDDEKPLGGFSGINGPTMDRDSTGEDEMEDDSAEPEVDPPSS